MTREEFERLTGFWPEYNYYWDEIHSNYRSNQLGHDGIKLNKEEWCKKWLEDDGIHKAYCYMCEKCLNLDTDLTNAKIEYSRLENAYNKAIAERDQAIEELKQLRVYKASYECQAHSIDKDTIEKLVQIIDKIK